MSDQFPPPGQPGEQPPTQMAPSGGAPTPAPYGAPTPPQQPGYPPAGGYPAPGQPGAPGGPGYPGGPGGPGGWSAPPTGGGGGSKKGLIIGIIAGVVVLVLIVVAILAFTVFKGDDDDPKKVSDEPTTSASTDATSSPSPSESESYSDYTESPTGGGSSSSAPTDDPTITARAFLDSLLTGECLAVEGLSTPEYFASEFTDQPGCKKVAGNLEMSNAEYTFEEPIVVGTFATVNGDVYAPNTGKTLVSTWLLDGSTGEWLVSGYSYTTDE